MSDPKHISEIIPEAVDAMVGKDFYCRKEVNKGIRCNSQCKACIKIDGNGL